MSCARCGCGIYKTEEFISLNKVWHKYCFTCYQCSKRLDKDTAKIFQGELFCECCYSNVIEKLFEVLSTPSIKKPCKVASTPSCAVTNNSSIERRLKNCEIFLKNFDNCRTKEYCFPAEKKLKNCRQRSTQSCSCIPSLADENEEYCFIFPIPREVANYYNRAHMKSKACKCPISCNQPQCPACNCRKTCSPQVKCPVQVRPLKNQCCCSSSSPPRCINSSPQRCCCCSPKPQPCPVFKKPCCCLPPQPICCDPCPSPKPICCDPCPPSKRCPSPYRATSPCQGCACYPQKPCKAKCPPPQCCPPNCCPTKCYVLPPRCPPAQFCSPQPCCPQKRERFCYSLTENPQNCCADTSKCYCVKQSKYCICGNLNPCNCKMSQIKAQCTVCCVRCGQKVYAAEKILVSCGGYHTSCFTCYCCNKCLDVKNVFEGCGEIYCKQCYNHLFDIEYYGFGGKNS